MVNGFYVFSYSVGVLPSIYPILSVSISQCNQVVIITLNLILICRSLESRSLYPKDVLRVGTETLRSSPLIRRFFPEVLSSVLRRLGPVYPRGLSKKKPRKCKVSELKAALKNFPCIIERMVPIMIND